MCTVSSMARYDGVPSTRDRRNDGREVGGESPGVVKAGAAPSSRPSYLGKTIIPAALVGRGELSQCIWESVDSQDSAVGHWLTREHGAVYAHDVYSNELPRTDSHELLHTQGPRGRAEVESFLSDFTAVPVAGAMTRTLSVPLRKAASSHRCCAALQRYNK